MQTVHVNGIDMTYETIGDRGGRPLVLIMGLATQMIAWPDPFCRALAAKGFYVIRFDNRDSGLSSKMASLGVPKVDQLVAGYTSGQTVRAPYTLSDMAADTIGLIDRLNIETAHFCGLSMGGAIAQIIAIEHPERIASLISMQSSTGERDLPEATPAAMAAMWSNPPVARDAYLDYTVEVYRAFAGGSDRYDPGLQRQLAARAYDRIFYPIGFTRQMAAILASAGRRRALATVTAPTQVIHGSHDTLLLPAHGKDTARAIPNAQLQMIDGLGHGMAYPTLWPAITEMIADFVRSGDQ